MERRFDNLLSLIEPIENADNFGDWFVDHEHKGTMDDPIQFPYPRYIKLVDKLVGEIYEIERKYPEYELYRYSELLEERQVEWGKRAMEEIDVSNTDLQGVLVLLMGMVRSERFCDGAIMGMLESGAVLRWLKRIKEIVASDDTISD